MFQKLRITSDLLVASGRDVRLPFQQWSKASLCHGEGYDVLLHTCDSVSEAMWMDG